MQRKRKMTRECDFGQVNFIDKRYKDAANLPVKQQFQQRIPHVVCKTFIRTRNGRNTRSWAFHGSHKVQQGTVKGCARKRAESKPHVMQCARESHGEPDEEQSTNSRWQVTMLFQFYCYVILPRRLQCCCKNRNKQRYQSYDEPNV